MEPASLNRTVIDLDKLPEWRARRRAAILDAAAMLFARLPYGEVQMDEVAHEAGVGKATLYRYFPSKETLFLESFERALTGIEERLRHEVEATARADQALMRLLEVLLDALAGHLPSLKAMGGDQPLVAERGRQAMRRPIRAIRALLRETLVRGIEQGRFRRVDLDVTPQLLIGMVRAAVMAPAMPPRQRLVDAILDLVLGGGLALRPQPAARDLALVSPSPDHIKAAGAAA